MAKKRKKFQKKQLLSLYESANYQKVISKIKQYNIVDMEADELLQIQVDSYRLLIEENFQRGDITRAIRDVESLISLSDNVEYKLQKLKYLCYLEHFSDAILLAEELNLNKNPKIKKESVFFYLLAHIYSANYEIDPKQLKLLSAARQNYILAMRELFRDDKEKALEYLESCKPRAKIEKENIQAIKSLILDQEMHCSRALKPLYRFLLCMNSDGLQNSKNSRVVKQELSKQHANNTKEQDIKNLLSLKAPATVENILKSTDDKRERTKLIYNNIILLVEKKQKYSEALEIFVKNRADLVELVESAMLFIHIKMHLHTMNNNKPDKITLSFLSSYLKLHYEKLPEFQLDYIFFFLFGQPDTAKYFELMDQYGGGDMLFLLYGIPQKKRVDRAEQEIANRIFKKHSPIKTLLLELVDTQLKSMDLIYDELDADDCEKTKKYVYLLSQLLKNLEKPHKNYQKILFQILTSLALICQNFDLKKDKNIYAQLLSTINKSIEYYSIARVELSIDIKALFVSIERGKRIKKIGKKSEDDYMSMFINMFEDEDREERYDFDELEYDMLYIEKDFIQALIKGDKNPFKIVEKLKPQRFNNKIFDVIFSLMAEAKEADKFSDDFVEDLLHSLSITLEHEGHRGALLTAVNVHIKQNTEMVLLLLKFAIETTALSSRGHAWYLKWLEKYIDGVHNYKLPKDRTFKRYLHHYLKIQKKKNFKSQKVTEKRFAKLYDECIKQGGLFD